MSEIIIIILLTVSVLFTIMIWFRYRHHTTYKFDLYLYIGSNKHDCPIWVRSFALDPSSYTFLADSYIQNLRIQGCFTNIPMCVRFGVSHTCIRCVVQITFLRRLSLFLQLRTVFTVESVGYGL